MEMIKVKVSELRDVALDLAVAKLEGIDCKTLRTKHPNGGIILSLMLDNGNRQITLYSPTSEWAQAGYIIEREKIQLTPLNQDNPKYGWAAAYKDRGQYGDDFYDLHRQRGKEPLVAAMRCYVASKLGDEIESPSEFYSDLILP